MSESIHPLVIGEAYRSKDQIKMIAGKLLKPQIKNEEYINQIISFLCSESGGHDYTINRREAEKDLKLPVKNRLRINTILLKKFMIIFLKN